MTSSANTAIYFDLFLVAPSVKTVTGSFSYLALQETNSTGTTLTYQVATAGTYYVDVSAKGSGGIAYQLQVTAEGTPIGVPNPAQKGCVTGQVDYILYSLQLIAAKLPDEVSIGGTKLCASCDIKPPAYPELVERMEKSMAMNLNVSACYDASGNIFQLKLIHP